MLEHSQKLESIGHHCCCIMNVLSEQEAVQQRVSIASADMVAAGSAIWCLLINCMS